MITLSREITSISEEEDRMSVLSIASKVLKPVPRGFLQRQLLGKVILELEKKM